MFISCSVNRKMSRNMSRYEELDFKGLIINSLKLLTVRKAKRAALTIIGITVILYLLFRKGEEEVQSAITCKNKIADVSMSIPSIWDTAFVLPVGPST